VIRADISEAFFNHPNKGTLINDLLEEYFGKLDQPKSSTIRHKIPFDELKARFDNRPKEPTVEPMND
jgi:hypothetical protein